MDSVGKKAENILADRKTEEKLDRQVLMWYD